MIKPIIEWLKDLPEPYRSQAIKNCNRDYPYTGMDEVDNVRDALSGGFAFYRTPQGHEYWQRFLEKLND